MPLPKTAAELRGERRRRMSTEAGRRELERLAAEVDVEEQWLVGEGKCLTIWPATNRYRDISTGRTGRIIGSIYDFVKTRGVK